MLENENKLKIKIIENEIKFKMKIIIILKNFHFQ